MSDRPTSNVNPLPEGDQDLADVEELLERVLSVGVDAEAGWSLVRERIGLDRAVAQIQPRRRPRRVLALAIAAALMLSGVAFAAVTQRGRPAGQPTTPGVQAPHGAPGTAIQPETGREGPTMTPTPSSTGPGSPSAPTTSPEPGSGSPSSGTEGSDQQQGQDQRGGGDQQPSDQPSGQDQQNQPDPTDGGSIQSDIGSGGGGDQGSSPSAQAPTDQQS